MTDIFPTFRNRLAVGNCPGGRGNTRKCTLGKSKAFSKKACMVRSYKNIL